MLLLAGLSPERDYEVNELLADPGPVPQWGVIVHPFPGDGDEGGVHVLITHLHHNNGKSAEVVNQGQCYVKTKSGIVTVI